MSTPRPPPSQPSNFDHQAIEAACVSLNEARSALDKAVKKQHAVLIETMEAYGAKGDFSEEAAAAAIVPILEARTAARNAHATLLAADEAVLAAFRKKL